MTLQAPTGYRLAYRRNIYRLVDSRSADGISWTECDFKLEVTPELDIWDSLSVWVGRKPRQPYTLLVRGGGTVWYYYPSGRRVKDYTLQAYFADLFEVERWKRYKSDAVV